jgi:tetratricopeptide (TPR) repeat protein
MKKLLITTLLALLVCFCPFAIAEDTSTIKTQLEALSTNLDSFPAQFKDKQEEKSVSAHYKALKATLDKLLKQNPKDEELLFYRGKLQSMGHNADYKGAWQGATDDLSKLLKINPANVPALVLLGSHWVNSHLELAPNAEHLFIAAQCYQGTELLEDAQRGLFFALYYQGKTEQAAKQAKFLADTWPQVSAYKTLFETALGVLEKKNPTKAKEIKDTPAKSLISCAK